MATKPGVIYSTNPKMDTSGAKTDVPVRVSFGLMVSSEPIPGGALYLDALDMQAKYYGMRKTDALTNSIGSRSAGKKTNKKR